MELGILKKGAFESLPIPKIVPMMVPKTADRTVTCKVITAPCSRKGIDKMISDIVAS
jgi:hypothetical protein